MPLSFDEFKAQLIAGAVLYFVNDEMVHTTEPHFHIVVVSVQGMHVLVACTSKFETCRRYVTYNNYPMETLVMARPDGKNGLTMESHMNCNTVYERTAQELFSLYIQRQLRIRGTLAAGTLQQIFDGISVSPDVSGYIQDALKPFKS